MYHTAHTVRLQDGSLFNFRRRVKKHTTTLLHALTWVVDGRSTQGKRHPLENILFMLFCAILAECSNITECWKWAKHDKKWLSCFLEMPYGIPDPTTVSYALSICDVGSLITAWNMFIRIVYGKLPDTTASIDGKTMRGVKGTTIVRHMLSLFTHQTQQTIGQIGVSTKENEIPAAIRLFAQTPIAGLCIIADALHTQKETIKKIRKEKADYLLIVKENQKELSDICATTVADCRVKREQATDFQSTRGRSIETVVEVIHSQDISTYLSSLGWDDVAVIGKVRRTGTRTAKGETTKIDETVYFISSKGGLTAKDALQIIRGHWKIENNLHWQKDHTYDEDHQTVRAGNAPQVMSFLRSMSISLLKQWEIASITGAVTDFRLSGPLHHRFLAVAGVV